MAKFVVLLAGGVGKRLWPLSSESHPKQLMQLVATRDTGSLLQDAARRALRVTSKKRVITVTVESLIDLVRDQLAAVNETLARNVLVEPIGRNTAAAAASAALYVKKKDPNATLFIAPVDHVIRNEEKLIEAVDKAANLQNHLVVFGIPPTGPESEFGYIVPGDKLEDSDLYTVEKFVEKPKIGRASKLLEGQNTRWNSGLLVCTAKLLLSELRKHGSTIYSSARLAHKSRRHERGAIWYDEDLYKNIPEESLDTAVLQKSDRVAVLPVDLDWSDIGSFYRLWQEIDRDGEGNATGGDVDLRDCHNVLAIGGPKIKVVAVGLDGIVICATDDAVLVRPLRADGDSLRPWGSFRVLHETAHVKVKEITVNPGGCLSLQSHRKRSENWVVTEGTATVTCDGKVNRIGVSESVFLPAGCCHRLENANSDTLRLIEVQTGEYFGEDDIIRYEDEYGRVKQPPA